MARILRRPPPMWFWIVSAILLLWALAGLAAFYVHVTIDAAALAAMSDYDRGAYQALPGWFNVAFALATWPAVAGAAALLMRSRLAYPLYLASLIGVVIQFGYVFLATDLIAVKGAAATVPFPLFIFVMALVQLWFTRAAMRRSWLG